jgi:plasmid maintenance system killer protein
LPAESVDKIRKMLAFLDSMTDESELHSVSTWKAHQLGGNRKGDWDWL